LDRRRRSKPAKAALKSKVGAAGRQHRVISRGRMFGVGHHNNPFEDSERDTGSGDGETLMFKRTPVSRAELEAQKAFKPSQPETPEHERAQKAFHDNRERLKSERLAREAAADRSDR